MERPSYSAMITRLSDTKIIEFKSLLNHLLGYQLESQNERLKDLASGKIRINISVQQKIEEIYIFRLSCKICFYLDLLAK